MKNKIAVFLCAWIVMSLSVFCVTSIRADDAFVVEEAAVIGGENPNEIQVQVQPPAQVEPTVQVEAPVQSRKDESPTKAESGSGEMDSKQKEKVSVSQNSQPSLFRVPVKRSEPEVSIEPETSPEPEVSVNPETSPEPEIPSETEKKLWWLLMAGGVFLLGGCARVFGRMIKKHRL